MKVIITGSLGHVGKPLTEELVEKGHHRFGHQQQGGKASRHRSVGRDRRRRFTGKC